MPRFFVSDDDINGSTALIRGQDAVHIGRSLRMRLGDELTLCSGGRDYSCVIETISDRLCTLKVQGVRESVTEPDVRVTLFQAMPKSDKLELIVQKSVELGVSEICPVLTSRCVSRPDGKSFGKKLERLNKIALEAAKQCGRSIVPAVTELTTFAQAQKLLCENELALICYEKGGKNLRDAVKSNVKTIGLFIGSEGGFEQSEADSCAAAGAEVIGMGSRILRCETAPIAALSIIMSLTGNM